jgi:hypothetical protein
VPSGLSFVLVDQKVPSTARVAAGAVDFLTLIQFSRDPISDTRTSDGGFQGALVKPLNRPWSMLSLSRFS